MCINSLIPNEPENTNGPYTSAKQFIVSTQSYSVLFISCFRDEHAVQQTVALQ